MWLRMADAHVALRMLLLSHMQVCCSREVASRWRFLISGATASFSGPVAVPVDQHKASTRKPALQQIYSSKAASTRSGGCTRQENLPLQRSCSSCDLSASSDVGIKFSDKLNYWHARQIGQQLYGCNLLPRSSTSCQRWANSNQRQYLPLVD
jgi:hypothetical protein